MWEARIFWVTAAGVVVVAVGTGISAYMAYLTQKQVGAAVGQLEAANGQLKATQDQLKLAQDQFLDSKADSAASDKRQDRLLRANQGLAEAAKAQAAATAAMAGVGRGQLAVAQDTAKRQLRPYLAIGNDDEPATPITDDGNLTLRIKNFGRTPATDVKIYTGYLPIVGTIGSRSAPLEPQPESIGDIAPGDFVDYYVLVKDFKIPVSDIKSGIITIIYRIRVEYKSPLGVTDNVDLTVVIGSEQVISGKMGILSDTERSQHR